MITLYQNTVNSNIILTLSENVTYTASPVYFLFRFVDETTDDEKIFTASDSSTNIERYNSFTITLTGSSYENLTGGTINLPVDGKLKYEVYEMLSPTNLYLSGTSGTIIETGLVQVSGSTNMDVITNSYTGQTDGYSTYKFYQ